MGLIDGGPETIMLILVIIVLLFGSKKLPEMARSLGRARMEFERGKKQVMDEIKDTDLSVKDSGLDLKETIKKEGKKLLESDGTENKVTKAARDLGIDTVGKSEEELKKEIIVAMGNN